LQIRLFRRRRAKQERKFLSPPSPPPLSSTYERDKLPPSLPLMICVLFFPQIEEKGCIPFLSRKWKREEALVLFSFSFLLGAFQIRFPPPRFEQRTGSLLLFLLERKPRSLFLFFPLLLLFSQLFSTGRRLESRLVTLLFLPLFFEKEEISLYPLSSTFRTLSLLASLSPVTTRSPFLLFPRIKREKIFCLFFSFGHLRVFFLPPYW